MSTRSNLAIKLKDGTYLQAYCHYDGYPSHMLVELEMNWQAHKDAMRLVEVGDIRCVQDGVFEQLSDAGPAWVLGEPCKDHDYLYVYEDDRWEQRK